MIAGAKIGSGIGIVTGTLGVNAETVPSALVRLLAGALAGDKIGTTIENNNQNNSNNYKEK